MPPILLDTCAVIWIAEDQELAAAAVSSIDETNASGGKLLISPITAWEIGQLTARNRIQLSATPHRWFSLLLEVPGVELADMSPDILIESSFLPGKLLRDPADRIMAATARHLGATLMTRDRALLEYGKQGHVNVMAC